MKSYSSLLLATGCVATWLLGGSGCLEPYCEQDTDCRELERCNKGTNQCERQDGSVAWPLDGSVPPTDASAVADGGESDGGGPDGGGPDAGCGECVNPEPICNASNGECEACGSDPQCAALGASTPACDNGSCVECTDSVDHCGGTEPICETTGHLCGACTNHTQCANLGVGTPVCDSGPCVECLTSLDHCTDAARAVCDQGSLSCRPCENHIECAHMGGVCDQGTCLSETEVTYVDEAAPCTGNGTKTTPFCEIEDAIATGDPTLVILAATGDYAPIVVENQVVWIVGSTASVVIDGALGSSDHGVDVRHLANSDRADVTLERVTLKGESNGSGAGLHCGSLYPTPPVVRLWDVEIAGANTYGIQASDCTVTVRGGRIHSNDVGAASLTESTLVMNGVLVEDNSGGGLTLIESGFTIENTFVVHNGDGAAGTPGIGLVTPGSPAVLRHITVAFNDTSDLNTWGSGVACVVGDCTAVVLRSSILSDNHDGDLVAHTSLMNITPHYCVIKDGTGWTGGTGNLITDPGFLSGTDEHISSSSPCRGAGDPASPVTTDFDGDSRPTPAGDPPDCGADEVP